MTKSGGASGDACELLCIDLPHAEEVRSALPASVDLEPAAARAKALADPTRLRVAAALTVGGQMCGCDLAWVTDLAPNLVSHHLRALRAAGLASSARAGKLVMYQLTATGRTLLTAVLGDDPAARPALEARVTAMGARTPAHSPAHTPAHSPAPVVAPVAVKDPAGAAGFAVADRV